jgi:hypothetical protein
MHRNNHDGMVLLGDLSCCFLTFVSVKHLVVGWANNAFAKACSTLLWQLFLVLLTCLFLQHESSCRHVSFCWKVHKLHVGDMYFLRTYFL